MPFIHCAMTPPLQLICYFIHFLRNVKFLYKSFVFWKFSICNLWQVSYEPIFTLHNLPFCYKKVARFRVKQFIQYIVFIWSQHDGGNVEQRQWLKFPPKLMMPKLNNSGRRYCCEIRYWHHTDALNADHGRVSAIGQENVSNFRWSIS